MTDTAFDTAFRIVVGIEGGYTPAKPSDPGGETKFGISKAAYPHLDIPGLTLDKAKAIYFTDYWLVMLCDRLPWLLALPLFDGAVNHGVTAAAVMFQRALGNVAVDGKMGPQTITVAKAGHLDTTLVHFMGHRAMAYASDPHYRENGEGWFRRAFSIVWLVDNDKPEPDLVRWFRTFGPVVLRAFLP